jgi:outer membrane protein assembly factor BamB
MVVVDTLGNIASIDPSTHNRTFIGSVSGAAHGAVNVHDAQPLVSVSGSGYTVQSLNAGGWSSPVEDFPSAPNTNGDHVFVTTPHKIYDFDRTNGNQLNAIPSTEEIDDVAGPAIVPESDLSIIVATRDGNVRKIDPKTGTPHWTASIPGVNLSDVSIALNGTIYAPSFQGQLYAISPDGKVLNHFDSGTSSMTLGAGQRRLWGPALATVGNKSVAYVADLKGMLTAVDDNGDVLWQSPLPAVPVSQPIAAGEGVFIEVGGQPNSQLIAIGHRGAYWSQRVSFPGCWAAARDGYLYGVTGGATLWIIKVG